MTLADGQLDPTSPAARALIALIMQRLNNFWLHVVTPLATVVLLQCVESGVALTKLKRNQYIDGAADAAA